jgi:hypothetical protein
MFYAAAEVGWNRTESLQSCPRAWKAIRGSLGIGEVEAGAGRLDEQNLYFEYNQIRKQS